MVIKLNNEIDNIICLRGGTLKLYPVIITIKKWLRKPKTINCYPTNYGPTYWGPDVVFFYYIDDDGKRLSDDICEQINDWCRVETIKNKLNI